MHFEYLETSDEPRRDLSAFVDFLVRYLINILYERYLDQVSDGRVFVDPDHLPMLQAAYEELRDSGEIERLFQAIEASEMAVLTEHGLTGRQLTVKVEAVKHRERRFLRLPRFPGFKRLIDAIDNLLESVIDAVGAGGAVKEFKDVLASLTEDG